MIAILIPEWPPGIPEEHLRQDPGLAERLFLPVLAELEEVTTGIEALRPGLCALRGRGVSRYYGGEAAAAAAIRSRVREIGYTDARVGIADGVFAATQAAHSPAGASGVRTPAEGLRIVSPGEAAAFLAPLPIERAAEPPLSDTLHGLGIRTLGQLAALPESSVRDRFGPPGIAAHRRSRAATPAHGVEVRPRQPAKDLAVELELEPPVDTAEQLAFACAQLAERFVAALAEERLVCTALRVELTDDIGVRHERLWAHPRHFTASDTVNRVRWQLAAMPQHAPGEPPRGGAGIAHVRLAPAQTDRAAAHEPALWSTGPDERTHHRFTQVQSRLGHAEIGTAQLGGGRLLTERQQLVPWGTALRPRRQARGPWPGALPGPLPSTVFPRPVAVELLSRAGEPVAIDDDGLLAAPPTGLRAGEAAPARVTDWSLPWPLRELWWEGRAERWRLQVQTATDSGSDSAWLLVLERGRWFAEGRYD